MTDWQAKLLAYQPAIVVVNEEQNGVVAIDVTIPAESNIKKKVDKKIQKYRDWKKVEDQVQIGPTLAGLWKHLKLASLTLSNLKSLRHRFL